MFAANPQKLALAIQWSVICRTGDRRNWRLSGYDEDDDFLRILGDVIEQSQDGTESPQTLRLMALRLFKRRCPSRGGDDPLWCQFLQCIEEHAPESTHVVEQDKDTQNFCDFDFYRVNTTDLANLLDAIRGIRVCGFPMFHDPATVAMTVLYARDPAELPLKALIVEATKAVLLSHRRDVKRAQKMGMLDVRGSSISPASRPAQHGVDEEQDLGLPLDSALNQPAGYLEAVSEAAISRENPVVHAEGAENSSGQVESPEMNQIAQGPVRKTPSGDIQNTDENELPGQFRRASGPLTTAIPGAPPLHEPETGANAKDDQDSGQAAQQGYITARDRQRMEMAQNENHRYYPIYTPERFAVNVRGGRTHHRGGGGRQGRDQRQDHDEHSVQDARQAPEAPPNDPDAGQPATSVGQQILGKRRRESESESVESAEEFRMPYFIPDEVIFDRNINGVITGMRPRDPLADGSNMVVENYPRNGTHQFKVNYRTDRGKEVLRRLSEQADVFPPSGVVDCMLAPYEEHDLAR